MSMSRVLVTAWGLSALSAVTLAQAPVPLPLKTSWAFTADVAVSAPIVVGAGAEGLRRFVPITGGSVLGPRLSGRVLAGSGDWQVVRADDVLSIDARYIIETTDGVRITVSNRGLRTGPPAVMERLTKGEPVAASEYYFRTAAQFDAPRGSRYEWLNRAVFIGVAERKTDAAVIHFYLVE